MHTIYSLLGATDAPFDTLRRGLETISGSPPEVIRSDKRVAVEQMQRAFRDVCALWESMSQDVTLARIIPMPDEGRFITGKMKEPVIQLRIKVLNEGSGRWEESIISLENISQIEIYEEHQERIG